MNNVDQPSDGAILERAFSLANEAMFTVALQVRRTRTTEPEDEVFVIRPWADLQFLVVALRRLRRAAELARKVPAAEQRMERAIASFDAELPALLVMRNVGEHFDDYAIDSKRRRHKAIGRRHLQSRTIDGTTFEWLDGTLDTQQALASANSLFNEVRVALRTYEPPA